MGTGRGLRRSSRTAVQDLRGRRAAAPAVGGGAAVVRSAHRQAQQAQVVRRQGHNYTGPGAGRPRGEDVQADQADRGDCECGGQDIERVKPNTIGHGPRIHRGAAVSASNLMLWAAGRARRPLARWDRVRGALAWWAQVANLADLATTFANMAVGNREVGIVPALLIARGCPAAFVILALKAAAALTIWGLWRAAGASMRTSCGRIGILSGSGGMAVLAGILTWVTMHNLAVLLAP